MLVFEGPSSMISNPLYPILSFTALKILTIRWSVASTASLSTPLKTDGQPLYEHLLLERYFEALLANLLDGFSSTGRKETAAPRHKVEGVHRLGSLSYHTGPSEPRVDEHERATCREWLLPTQRRV